MSIFDLFSDYTLRVVATGAAILGIVSGSIGAFAVLRKQSLLGDAISHAALPGIALAFILTRSKAPLILVVGATISGWIATLFIMSLIKNTRIKDDTALGLVLSVFFGFGLVLLTFIQKLPDANQAGLDTFLFGQAATLLIRDIKMMAVFGIFILSMMIIFWKEFKLLSFDPGFGNSEGFPMKWLDIFLTTLIVIAIVIGLQTVGVVLMSAMIVAPAAAARQWTNNLGMMVLYSGLFGALAGISGALMSSSIERMPTGPIIVLCLGVLVIFSLIFAPNRGLFWQWIREYKNREKIQLDAILSDLQILANQHGSIEHGHAIEVLRTMSIGHGGVDRSLKELQAQGLVKQLQNGNWILTQSGAQKAKQIGMANL